MPPVRTSPPSHGGATLEQMLERMRIAGGPKSPSELDALAQQLKNQLNLNVGDHVYKTMALQVVEEQMSALRLQDAKTLNGDLGHTFSTASESETSPPQLPSHPRRGRSPARAAYPHHSNTPVQRFFGKAKQHPKPQIPVMPRTRSQSPYQFNRKPALPLEEKKDGESLNGSSTHSSNFSVISNLDVNNRMAGAQHAVEPPAPSTNGVSMIDPSFAARYRSPARSRCASPAPDMDDDYKLPGSPAPSRFADRGASQRKPQPQPQPSQPKSPPHSINTDKQDAPRSPTPTIPNGYSYNTTKPRIPLSPKPPSTPRASQPPTTMQSPGAAARPGLQEDVQETATHQCGQQSPRVPSRFRDRSNTPQRRGMLAEEHGTGQPAPPRSFSRSPMRARMVPPTQLDADPTMMMHDPVSQPDLSIPDFAGAVGGGSGGINMPPSPRGARSMFTPPPRYGDAAPTSEPSIFKTGPYKARTKETPENHNSGTPDYGAPQLGAFAVGTSESRQWRRNLQSRRSNNRSMSLDRSAKKPHMQTPQDATGTAASRDDLFSPMDYEITAETPPPPPPPVPMTSHWPPPPPQQPNLTESSGFHLGTASGDVIGSKLGSPRNRLPRRRIPRQASTTQADNALTPPRGHGAGGNGGGRPTSPPQINKTIVPPPSDATGVTGLITSLREEARSYYMNGDYRSSIVAYTRAIGTILANETGFAGDVTALLLSNRAAALMMVGAFEAAAQDCLTAMQHVSPANDAGEPFSSDAGPPLEARLYTRLARALLKQGDHEQATAAFENAMDKANRALALSEALHTRAVAEQHKANLGSIITEATLGKADSQRLAGSMNALQQALERCHAKVERHVVLDAMAHVKMALSFAAGSVALYEAKLELLARLKCWRELAGCCERLAALNVRMDEVFVGDLEGKNPFLAAPALYLSSKFFGESREEDAATADLKLNSKAAAEAVLRLPFALTPYYLRSLRLEERYPAAEAATKALDELVNNNAPLRVLFDWLPAERSKLKRTKTAREHGDDLFRRGETQAAAEIYSACLKIDADIALGSDKVSDAGGRLHAVLHCNRAACLIQDCKYAEALEDCSAALRIHPHYMKAMLRRGRCYMRLNRHREAIAEFKRWLEIVDEARRTPEGANAFVATCLFDGPGDASDADVNLVQSELEKAHVAKREAAAAAREEARRRQDQQRWQENNKFTNGNSRFQSGTSAQQRRDEWRNQQDDSRRWDSFPNRGPRSSSTGHHRSHSWHDSKEETAGGGASARSRTRQQSVGSPGSDETLNHYAVLQVLATSTDEEIRKAYRKLALKYHPDKNKTDGAADKFRRIKMAYECLGDVEARRRYDEEQRRPRAGRFF